MNDNNTVTANNDSNTENAMRGNLFLGPEFTIVVGIVLFGAAELVKLVASLF